MLVGIARIKSQAIKLSNCEHSKSNRPVLNMKLVPTEEPENFFIEKIKRPIQNPGSEVLRLKPKLDNKIEFNALSSKAVWF